MKKSWLGVWIMVLMLAAGCQGSSGGGGGSDDGSVSTSAVLVSTTSASASDANNCLSASAPCLTIAGGLARAQALGKSEVHVADGLYNEQVTLVSGVNLRGGYNPATWKRRAVSGTVISPRSAPDGRAVMAQNLTSPTVFDGFVIMGPNPTTPGESSYGLWIRDCDNRFTASNNVIYGGNGARGLDGVAGLDGTQGQDGQDGQPGVDIIDAYGVAYHGCVDPDHDLAGGYSGVNSCAAIPVSGGAGGLADCPLFTSGTETDAPHANEAGGSGQGASPGAGGAAGRDVYQQIFTCQGYTSFGVPQGGSGQAGGEGADGAAAGGPGSSSVDPSGFWWGPVSADGSDGTDGSGGGGGGSGGGAYIHDSCFAAGYGGDNLGGSGGGGGAGGCGGGGGTAGQAGGGSFAVFVSFNAPPANLPQLTDNVIHTGHGGAGGNGGLGGPGGPGGAGGAGGAGSSVMGMTLTSYPAFPGGAGGDGGDGGSGSGGGGGVGGPSYGIYAADYSPADPTAWKSANTVILDGSPGAGGSGGYSAGNPGPTGSTGSQGNFNF